MLEIPNCRPIIPTVEELEIEVPANDGTLDYGIIPQRGAYIYEFEVLLTTTVDLPFTPFGTENLEIYKEGVRIINITHDFGQTYSEYVVDGNTVIFTTDQIGKMKFISDYLIEPSVPEEYKILVDNIQGGETLALSEDETYAGTFCEPVVCTQPYMGYARLSDDRKYIIYVPNQGYTGEDSFSYTVKTQRNQLAEPQCVFITVVEPPPPPEEVPEGEEPEVE